jgi:hypothetical protein
MRRSLTACFPWIATAVIAAASCGGDDAARTNDRAGVTRRDSAGIEIVENGAPVLGEWRLDSALALQVGHADDAARGAAYQFGRLVGVARMRDGGLVVADFTSKEVRLFDSTGTFNRAIVREGGGPGEMYRVGALYHTRDDSILVADGESSTLTVFGPDLALVRKIRPVDFRPDTPGDPHRGSPGLHGIFDDGSVLGSLRSTGNSSTLGKTGDVTGFTFVDSVFLARGVVGDERRQLAEIGWIETERGFAFRIPAQGGWGHTLLLAPQTSRALRGAELYVAPGSSAEVRVIGRDGRLRRIVRAQHPQLPVRPGDHPMFAPAGRGLTLRLPDGRTSTLSATFPDPPSHHPVADEVHVDPSGSIWLRCLVATRPLSRAWLVFDSSGVLRHRVADPGGMDVVEIGESYMVGVARDDDGVESAALRRIRKPAR